MNLNNLDKWIDPVILARGQAYADEGSVLSIEEQEDGTYYAEVEGSELYEVYVELDESGNVVSAECDCPYDYGPVCKHQAAALIELRDQLAEQPERADQRTAKESLEQLLEAESKESLVQLLLSLAADSKVVKQRINLHVAKAGGAAELDNCRKMIRLTIDANADRHGFIDWRSVDGAVEGAEKVAERAFEAAEREEWVRAVELHLCVVEGMVELNERSDDSSGTIGAVIAQSLEGIYEITSQSDPLSPEDKTRLFHTLLNESGQRRYDGWSDEQLELIEAASRLAVNAELRQKWEQRASDLVSRQTGRESYVAERIAMIRYRLIQSHEGDEQAAEYGKSQLHLSNFRELAIQEAFRGCRYDEVIQLAEEGERLSKEKGFPGLVSSWKKRRYEAYRLSGQLELQREVGVELILDGDYSYYAPVRDTYPPAEWPPVYRRMLDQMEKEAWPRTIYTKILVEEQEHSRLLAYVRKQPGRIEQFYSYLHKVFPGEVAELFHSYIVALAEQSTNRKEYKNVCRVIRMLQQAAGSEAAQNMTKLLLETYPNRPAFREELLNLGKP
ncbi:SWIM zinc finger family protein [Paenibacillus oceani]|uniref:SWIM zinc finger family protein n=1 Tax=Paenibacillus oceani TaxID=2772510 RepID=A0A927CE95_9BACL|nr:DUF6880 family protein [Paenibacillus oceani]MBD2864621.1 SWIM zinc finger family protein [Paenibacillus oceani]